MYGGWKVMDITCDSENEPWHIKLVRECEKLNKKLSWLNSIISGKKGLIDDPIQPSSIKHELRRETGSLEAQERKAKNNLDRLQREAREKVKNRSQKKQELGEEDEREKQRLSDQCN